MKEGLHSEFPHHDYPLGSWQCSHQIQWNPFVAVVCQRQQGYKMSPEDGKRASLIIQCASKIPQTYTRFQLFMAGFVKMMVAFWVFIPCSICMVCFHIQISILPPTSRWMNLIQVHVNSIFLWDNGINHTAQKTKRQPSCGHQNYQVRHRSDVAEFLNQYY